MGAGALLGGEQHQRLGAGQVVVELLRLALEELVLGGVADQGGALDPFGDAVVEGVVEVGGVEGAGGVDAHDVHAVVDRPSCGRVGGHDLFEGGVEFGGGVGAQEPFGLRAAAGDVAHGYPAEVVDAVDGDQRGQPVFEGRGPWGEEAAHAGAQQRDPAGVDLWNGLGEVDHGGDDLLPVRTEDEALVVAGPGLSGAVEGQHGVAALDGRQRAAEVQFLGGAVEAGVHDQGRPGRAGGVGAVEVAGQGGALVGDADRLDARGVQGGGRPEALHAAVVGVVVAGVAGVAVQEELGRAVVVGRPEEAVPGAHPVACRQGPPGLVGDPVGGGQPLVVPAVVVAFHDALAGGHDLAEVGAAVGDVTHRAQGLVPELGVVREQQLLHRTHSPRRHQAQICAYGRTLDPPGATKQTSVLTMWE
ncbi:hypothetical protein ATKI12_8434 [Kitasatospora sp. Ki12]